MDHDEQEELEEDFKPGEEGDESFHEEDLDFGLDEEDPDRDK